MRIICLFLLSMGYFCLMSCEGTIEVAEIPAPGDRTKTAPTQQPQTTDKAVVLKDNRETASTETPATSPGENDELLRVKVSAKFKDGEEPVIKAQG